MAAVDATTMVRLAVLEYLVDKLREGLPGVPVFEGPPGNQVFDASPELVWAEDIEGDVDLQLLTGEARQQRDDVFTIPFRINIVSQDTLLKTLRRLVEIAAPLENTLAVSPHLEDLTGVSWAETGTVRGPYARELPDAFVGDLQFNVKVTTRLT